MKTIFIALCLLSLSACHAVSKDQLILKVPAKLLEEPKELKTL